MMAGQAFTLWDAAASKPIIDKFGVTEVWTVEAMASVPKYCSYSLPITSFKSYNVTTYEQISFDVIPLGPTPTVNFNFAAYIAGTEALTVAYDANGKPIFAAHYIAK